MKARLLRLFDRLPYRWRMVNRAFVEWTARLASFESLPEPQARARQFTDLEALVRLAYERTAFYRERWDAAGFHPRDLRAPDDLERIPILTKEEVRAHGHRMIVGDRRPEALRKLVTSGTTGTPLTLYTDHRSTFHEWASICWQWARVGYEPTMGRIELRGVVTSETPFVEVPAERVLRVNVHALNERSLPAVLEAMRRAGYRFLHGYPSAIEKLCELVEATGLASALAPPAAILLSSEVVYDRQKERIRATFPESRLFAHYGQAERVALAGWVGDSEAYHFLPGHGIVEQDPTTGEIIGTGFGSEVMPLVRYRLSDVAHGFEVSPKGAGPTLFPVAARIDGRLEDYLYKPDGERIPPAIVTFPFKDGRTYSRCRLVQHALDRIEIVVEVRAPEAAVRAELATIVDRLRILFGPVMRFDLSLVDAIPRSAAGKFRWLENRVEGVRRSA